MRQYGVVSRPQLRRLGYSDRMIHGRVARAHLHRIHRGVYAVGHTSLSIKGRWLAAVLACGPGAVLSHGDAAALHDLMRVGSGLIHVTSPGRHQISGIRCHHTRALHADDVTTVGAIPVTAIERTISDMAKILNRRRLRAALEQAQRQSKLDFSRLEAVIVRSPRCRGVVALRRALAELGDEPVWTQSDLEDRFLELVRAHDLPQPRANVFVDGFLVDFYWPNHNLVVEVDSYAFHATRATFERDRQRDVRLTEAGRRVVRFSYRRIDDTPADVAADVRRLLRAGPSPPPARSDP